MCYGLSGTVDGKGVVRCAFTSSHDEKVNKPDEVRRKYWEWELHFPNLKKPVFSNEGEDGIGVCPKEFKKKVVEWCLAKQGLLKQAFGDVGERQNVALFGKAKTGYLGFRKAKTGYLGFQEAKTGYLDFRKAKTGDLGFQKAKTGYLDFWEAKTGDLGFQEAKTGDLDFQEAKTGKVFIKDMEPKDKKLAGLIKEFSKDRGWSEATLAEFAKWCIKKGEAGR